MLPSIKASDCSGATAKVLLSLVGRSPRKTIRSKASPLICTVQTFTTAACPEVARNNEASGFEL